MCYIDEDMQIPLIQMESFVCNSHPDGTQIYLDVCYLKMLYHSVSMCLKEMYDTKKITELYLGETDPKNSDT